METRHDTTRHDTTRTGAVRADERDARVEVDAKVDLRVERLAAGVAELELVHLAHDMT